MDDNLGDKQEPSLAEMASRIVAAYVSFNKLNADDLPRLFRDVYLTLFRINKRNGTPKEEFNTSPRKMSGGVNKSPQAIIIDFIAHRNARKNRKREG